MYQTAIESYCFRIHPSLKIRYVLIIHKDITENTEYKTHTKFVAVIDSVQLPDFQQPVIHKLKALNLVVIKFPIGKAVFIF